MNHYHDHERQTRRFGGDQPKRPWQILRDLHKCVKQQANLLFQLQCHPDRDGAEKAMKRLSELSGNRPAEQWESLRKQLWEVGVHLYPYHELPMRDSPIQRFSGGMTDHKWMSLTSAGLQRRYARNKQTN